jgi:hypothetical protein
VDKREVGRVVCGSENHDKPFKESKTMKYPQRKVSREGLEFEYGALPGLAWVKARPFPNV